MPEFLSGIGYPPESYPTEVTMMRKSLGLMVVAALLVLAGCNTIAGVGKDVESGGAAIEGAAKDVQKKM